MRMQQEKTHKVRNNRLITAIVLGACIVGVAGYKLFLSTDDAGQNHGVNFNTGLDSGANQIDRVNSPLIRQTHQRYEQQKEKNAREQNTSFISTVGSINPIKKSDRQLIHPETNFDYQSALKQRQTRHVADIDNKPQMNKSADEKISTAFSTAIGELNQSQQNHYRATASGYQTITPVSQTQSSVYRDIPETTHTVIGQIDAGTTLYGVIENAINSDFKTPVIADIQMGKYRGAKVFGKFTVRDQWVDGISIEFNKMIWRGITFTIQAIAINADYLPNLYDDIDHHYLQRFGGLIAGATFGAIQGAAQPYQGKNTPTVIVGSSGSQTQIYTPPDGKQIAYSAAGGAATNISGQLQPAFTNLWNRPTTVSIDRGHGIGILFTETAEIKTQGAK